MEYGYAVSFFDIYLHDVTPTKDACQIDTWGRSVCDRSLRSGMCRVRVVEYGSVQGGRRTLVLKSPEDVPDAFAPLLGLALEHLKR